MSIAPPPMPHNISTNTQKQQACGVLPSFLEQFPVEFMGNIDPAVHASVVGVVRRLRLTRSDFIGPVFQPDGATFISDPIIVVVHDDAEAFDTTLEEEHALLEAIAQADRGRVISWERLRERLRRSA